MYTHFTTFGFKLELCERFFRYIQLLICLSFMTFGTTIRSCRFPLLLSLYKLSSATTTAFSSVSSIRTSHQKIRSLRTIPATAAITTKPSSTIAKMSLSSFTEVKKTSPFKHIHSTDIEGVRNSPKTDGKRPNTASTTSFLLTVVVGVPLWLTVAVPLTVVYQAGKAIFPKSPTKSEVKEDPVAQETFPATEDLKPLPDRKYDAVILGCTGFTGRLAAIYLAKNYSKLKWAIAGRSEAKLAMLKKELEDMLVVDASNIDTLIVDTSKPSTLHKLVDDTKVVITTAGPFAKYGSNVVEFW